MHPPGGPAETGDMAGTAPGRQPHQPFGDSAVRPSAAREHHRARRRVPDGVQRHQSRAGRRAAPVPRRLWARVSAADNYSLVLVLIVVSILLVAVIDELPALIPTPILFAGTLLYAVRTSRIARRLQMLATVLVGASLAVAVGSAVVTGRTGLASSMDLGVAALLVVLTPLGIARRLLAHPAVNVSTVAGALCIYLLVGLFFAFLFGFATAVGLGPFFASTERAEAADYLYFSFSTLTTLGYGDLVARTSLGRMLAVTEALFGQMYLVTVVALLVSNFGRERRAGSR